jgi:predicted enzyme related to lactoylglutathione lyase
MPAHGPSVLVTGVSRRIGIAWTVVEHLHHAGWEVTATGWPPHEATVRSKCLSASCGTLGCRVTALARSTRVARTGRLPAMANVLGIGGVFVKSKDADALRVWYREMLGVEIQEWGGAQFWSTPTRTYTVWSAFRAESKYFEPSEREFMVNLRVDDLDGLLAKLRERGARVLDRREDSPDGKFGYVVDPDGTLLELWEAGSAA